jgi:competence protein ComEA
LAAYVALAVVIGLLGARYVRSSGAGGGAGVAAGGVRRPGVYDLPPGARVQDAVRRAGGPKPDANIDAVNLAARLVDGQQIVVPGPGAAPVAATGEGAPGSAPTAPVSLGSATPEQLQTLDGVGPATAQKIVAYRTEHGGFRSVDDLANVPGIGPKKLAAIKPHVQP